MFRQFMMILIFTAVTCIKAQSNFTETEKMQGYKISGEEHFFIFDEKVYNVKPEKVIVEGTFRGWDHNLEDSKWWLKKVSGMPHLWVLKSPAPIPLRSEFKFRINDGDWMEVPPSAPNVQGGNLIFGHTFFPPKFDAEMVGPRHIRALITGKDVTMSLNPQDYRLFKNDGIEIKIEQVFYIQPGEIHIYPAQDVDIKRVHYLQEKNLGLRTTVSYDGWFRHLYSDKKLGAFYDENQRKTIFRLFATRATNVKLYLYKNPGEKFYAQYNLKRDANGIWEYESAKNLNGIYYDYTVHGYDEPGNHFFETNPGHITDPYGQVSVDSFGPCRIVPQVQPPRPVKGGRPPMKDVIAYEVHVQDFTRNLPVDEKKKGTFSGFFEKGLKNSRGEKIGFDHIVDLGINVVHLQPVQEFLHFPTDEWQKHFLNDPFMIYHGIEKENYQWGYRTTHYLALESRYREKGSDWGAQNRQFRDLVQAFHDAGIAVIVDVVFNHSGERMDGRMDYFNFSAIDKPYYYRTTENLDYIGEYGTELKSEERPMVQRWLYDQCLNLVEQYGVDGFRIDIAGQTDEQTLKELKRRLPDDLIIYGEPWIASADPDYESNPDWDWYKADAPITFFQDNARNAFKGPTSNPQIKWTDRGYAGGAGNREEVKKALSAGFPEDDTPVDGINYLDIHDNWALADRFAKNDWDGRKGVDENRVKIAAALLFTSTGPVVIHGGTEFLRSKAHAPANPPLARTIQARSGM